MIYIKKSRYKPKYKKLISLRINSLNGKKILKFKKNKWNFLKSLETKKSKYKKHNCFYKFYDPNLYNMPKYTNKFKQNYKQIVSNKRYIKMLYGGILTKSLKKTVTKAKNQTKFNHKNINVKYFILKLLETRLDTILFRAHFVPSIRFSRQLISHGNVLVNNKIVFSNSYLLKKGDKITFKKEIHKLLTYNIAFSNFWPLPPKHLQISYKTFQIILIDNNLFSNNFNLKLNFNNI